MATLIPLFTALTGAFLSRKHRFFHALLRPTGALLLMFVVALALPPRLTAAEPLVVKGYDFSAYLAANGTVWTWGGNDFGQLGDGTILSHSTPQPVPGLTRVVSISAGIYHMLAVLSDGTVKTWGKNESGQLGNGTTSTQPTLTPIDIGLTNIKAVAAGYFHSLALSSNGTIMAWGHNLEGELGDGSFTSNSSPVKVSSTTTYRAIACGRLHSLAITVAGGVHAWGSDEFGQLGDDKESVNKSVPTPVFEITNALSIAAGENHSLAGIADGSVRTWGKNDYCQLGLGLGAGGNNDTDNRFLPETPKANAVTRVFAGETHSGYMSADSWFATWGNNSHGQCNRSTTDLVVNAPMGRFLPHNFHATGSGFGNHTLYVADDGTVHGWGSNLTGELGNGANGVIQPTEVITTTNWSLDAIVAIDAGRSHSIALKADGTVWTWGSDTNGELGDDLTLSNKSTPVQVSGLSGVYAIAAGAYHNLALTCSGKMWAWGQDTYGQLGNNATLLNQPTPVEITGASNCRAIGAGAYHSFGIRYDGALYAWGYNVFGQLGDGFTVNQPTPVSLSTTAFNNIIAVEGGYGHSIGLHANGSALSWGYNSQGQIGNGTASSTAFQLTPYTGIVDVVSIAAGAYHSAVTQGNGDMYSSGYDLYGQLGDNANLTDQPRFVPVSTTPTTPPRKKVSSGGAGGYHSLILQGNGTVNSVGRDHVGQLGNDASLTNQPLPVPVVGLNDIVAIAAGDSHSLALRHDGVVWSWGADSLGQLGDNTALVNQTTPVQVLSSWLPTITYNSAASLVTASEPSVDGAVVFARTLVNAGSVPITYTVGGTAVEGTTYVSLPVPRRVIIAGTSNSSSGSTSASVVINPIDNAVAADPKTVILTPLASSGYWLGSPTAGTVTINDNDVAGIIVSSNNAGAPKAFTSLVTNEDAAAGDHAFTFYVKLNSEPTGPVTIPIDSSNYSEGQVNGAAPLLLTFTNSNVGVAGSWATYQAVTVTGINDNLVDGNISYTISVGQPTTTDTRYAVLNPPDLSAVNKDNDGAGVTVTGVVAITEAAGASQKGTYTLRLNSQPPSGNNVTITATPNSQVTTSPSTLTFTSANWNADQTVTVTAIDDTLSEGPHTGTVTHTASGGGYGAVTIANLVATITDNDVAGYTIAPLSPVSSGKLITTESGGQGKFSLVLNSQPTDTVTISVTSSLPAEGVASTTSVQFTTATWNTAQTITVTGQPDGIADGDQAYQIVFGTPVSSDVNYKTLIPPPVEMVNQSVDTAAILVDQTSVITSETGGLSSAGQGTSSTFNVVLAFQPVSAVTVTLTAAAGLPNTQHTISTTSLIFNPSGTTGLWSTPQPVTLTGVNDSAIGAPASYAITLTATTATATDYSGKTAVVTALNQDDDSAGISVSSTTLTVTEAGGVNHSRSLGVRLTTMPTSANNVVLHFISGNTNAATISPSTLTFTSVNWSVLQNIAVTGVNDDIDGGNKTATITGVVDSVSDAAFTTVTVPSVAITVIDNDTAALVLSSSVLVTTEAGGSSLLSLRLATEPTSPVTLTITGLDATEGILSASTLSFTALNWATAQNALITGVDDQIDDGPISYALTVTASVPMGGDVMYAGKTDVVTIVNADDDTAGVELLDGTGSTLLTSTLTTTESGGTAQFSMRLKSQPTGDVTVSLVSGNTAEGIIFPSSLTFTSGDWNNAAVHVVTITGQSDLQDDGNVAYAIVTEAASSADPLYNTLNAADVAVVNTDNAANYAGFTLSTLPLIPLTITEAAGAGHSATFTVMLKSQPANNVTLFLASSDTTEGTVSPSVLTFTSADWNVVQTATVTAEDDIISDGSQTFSVVTTAASGDPKYNVGDLGISDVTVITTDDEIPSLTVTPVILTTTEASGGSRTTTFSINLACQPTVPVTVNMAITPGSNDGTEGTLSTSALTFSASTWFVPQFVTVTGVDDDVNDGDKTYSVVATASGAEYTGVTATIAVTNIDDDSPGVVVTPISGLTTTELGGTANFTVRLTSQPLNDVTITLISSNNAEGIVAAGGVPLVLTFTAVTWDLAQSVIVTGVDDMLVDADVAYQITVTATSSDSDYNSISISSVSVTNTDNEVANLPPVAVASTFSTVMNLTVRAIALPLV